MRINTKNYPTRYIVISVVVLIAIMAGSAWWYFSARNDNTSVDTADSSVDVEPAPGELSDEDAAAKQKFIEEQQDQSDSPGSDNDSNPPDIVDSSSTVTLAAKQDGASVTIVTQIKSIGDGSCALSIKNSTKSYDATAEVIYQPAYSTCAGFTVPVSKLGKGTWSITLLVTSVNGTKATATSSLGVS